MNYERLLDSVKLHEGYREIPYRDHLGNWTVGTGHLIHRIDLVNMANFRTVGNLLNFLTDPAQHVRWLEEDIKRSESDARRYIGDIWSKLSPVRQEVLTEMAFQLGGERLAGFAKLKSAIESSHWVRANAEMLDSLWYRQTPNRAKELASRMLEGLQFRLSRPVCPAVNRILDPRSRIHFGGFDPCDSGVHGRIDRAATPSRPGCRSGDPHPRPAWAHPVTGS